SHPDAARLSASRRHPPGGIEHRAARRDAAAGRARAGFTPAVDWTHGGGAHLSRVRRGHRGWRGPRLLRQRDVPREVRARRPTLAATAPPAALGLKRE